MTDYETITRLAPRERRMDFLDAILRGAAIAMIAAMVGAAVWMCVVIVFSLA